MIRNCGNGGNVSFRWANQDVCAVTSMSETHCRRRSRGAKVGEGRAADFLGSEEGDESARKSDCGVAMLNKIVVLMLADDWFPSMQARYGSAKFLQTRVE